MSEDTPKPVDPVVPEDTQDHGYAQSIEEALAHSNKQVELETQDAADYSEPANEEVDEKDDGKANSVPSKEYNPQPQVTLTKPWRGKARGDNETLLYLPVRASDANRIINNAGNLDLASDAKAAEWGRIVYQSYQGAFQNNEFNAAVDDPDSDWQQGFLDDDGIFHTAYRVKVGSKDSSESSRRLTGITAMSKINASFGLGGEVCVPLPHSGFWLTITPPKEMEILSTETAIVNEKSELGRQTNGAIFGNTSVYFVKHIMHLLKRCTISHNITEKDIVIEEHILSPDIQVIAWALGLAMYPNGYDYTHPCVSDPKTCNEKTTGNLNISRLLWIDNSKLTTFQKRHLSAANTTVSLEDVNRYKDEGKLTETKPVVLKTKAKHTGEESEVKVNLKTPTVAEYIASGYTWINEMIENIHEMFEGDMSEDQLKQMIQTNSKLTQLRVYSHYLKNIVFSDNTYVEGKDVLNQAIDSMSGDQDTVYKLLTEIGDYIDMVTVSLIAMPSYPCPTCSEEPSDEYMKHPELIPLDAINMFFTLVDLRLLKVR